MTVPADGTACLTITAEAPGLHKVVLIGGNAGNAYAHVFDGETEIDCYDPEWGVEAGASCPVRAPSRSSW